MKNKQRELVAALLGSIDVRRIVYVDDIFDTTVETLHAFCDLLTAKNLAKRGLFKQVFDDAGDEDIAFQEVKDLIAVASTEDLVSYAKRLRPAMSRRAKDEDSLAADAFSLLKPEGVDYQTLGLVEWRASKERLLHDTETIPTLFVFDDDLSRAGGAANEGRRLLAEVVARKLGLRAACALLTQKVGSADEEEALQRVICEAEDQLRDSLVVIAKTSLTKEKHRFPNRLKMAILSSRFEELKTTIRAAVAGAQAEALSRVDELNVEEFEGVVFHSSDQEGAWAPETLLRVYGIHQERAARASLRSNEELHSLIDAVRPVSAIAAALSPLEQRRQRAASLQRTECYDTETDVNPLCLPVQPGDIFRRSSDSTEFVLVAGACDLMVRGSGFRANAQVDPRQMVVLAPIMIKAVPTDKKGKPRRSFVLEQAAFRLPHYEKEVGQYSFAALSKGLIVPLWLLDLCAYSTVGKCFIDGNGEPPKNMPLPWRSRHGFLKEQMQRVVSTWAAASRAIDKVDRPVFRGALLRLPPNSEITSQFVCEGGWSAQLGLRRVGRVREPWAAAMLKRYSAHVARPAHPHDLSNIGKR